ncbi:MAG: 9-O-acetylesterase, partial [Lentisphaeria bacterium]|nr:9-O-acetylesterase [Lentisphaeria bacterium]
FEIIGEGTDFLPADARIDGETVILSHPDIKQPAAMRFAWHKLSEPNLTNAAGLPGAAFRAGKVPVIDYFQLNVPEAGELTLVYDLAISKHGADIVYDVNNADQIKKFSRVAYFLELQTRGQPVQYVYVAMDAFTDDATKIGVPTAAANAVFQTKVGNLTVLSNVKGIQTGVNLPEAGCIEFWHHNYSPQNTKGIPGASDQLWDFGDDIGLTKPDGYGCMQVHNYAAKQTIFAYNTWKSGQNADLGIGNSPPGAGSAANTRDWTFHKNASNYSLKRLRVFVR